MTITLHRTECITFPRSGHHLLHDLLARYFREGELRYCEMYKQPRLRLDVEPRTNFQKNHDLQLATPIRSDRRYVVQVRYPVDAIISWYKMACAETLQDSPLNWTSYALQAASFWLRFYRKWVLNEVPERLVVNYSDVLANPHAALRDVVMFLGDAQPDAGRIARACNAEPIQQRNFYRSFKYYGPVFFEMFKGMFATTPGIDLERDGLEVPAHLAAAGRCGAMIESKAVAAELSALGLVDDEVPAGAD